MQPGFGENAGAFRRDLAIENTNNSLRQIVRFDLIFQRQLSQSWGKIPVAAHNAL